MNKKHEYPQEWYLISKDDVDYLRDKLEHTQRAARQLPRLSNRMGKLLHTLNTGLHTTDAVPADYAPTPSTNAPAPRCEHPGCRADAYGYPHPVRDETVWLCDDHAASEGYCCGCGGFFGGIESFHFGDPPGMCESCRQELRDMDYNEELHGDW